MPCGWGVKAGMVRESVESKTVHCYHGSYLSTLAMGSSHNRALYKCPITLLTNSDWSIFYVMNINYISSNRSWTKGSSELSPSSIDSPQQNEAF